MAAAALNGPLELEDVQGLLLRGYGSLRAARYLLLRMGDAAAARGWLRALADRVTTAQRSPDGTAVNVALTAPGLAALGLPAAVLAGFALEFTEGMTSPHRSRILGDVDESAPERWAWGSPGGDPVHVLLLLFARDQAGLGHLDGERRREAEAAGLRVVASLDTVDLGDHEHFGFHDGISQPVMVGSGQRESALNTIQPGEFLLGYVNEHGQLTERPVLAPGDDPDRVLPRDGAHRPDLGRNGTYLVMRQLRQDVRGFWRWADEASRAPDGSADPDAMTRLAAKMVGRWPGGAPLVLAPEHDDQSLAAANDFAYQAPDPDGLRCPVGAHVRRANPRDSLDPKPGTQQSIAVGKRHRLIRRGREYGAAPAPGTLLDAADDGVDRGLHFICLCGNIARQFEFVQATWVISPKFDGLHEDDDPLLGARGPGAGTFRVQGTPVRRRHRDLPRFITVRGGGYFFLPGLRALRYLSRT
jgi:Dyp-type peroxidase family